MVSLNWFYLTVWLTQSFGEYGCQLISVHSSFSIPTFPGRKREFLKADLGHLLVSASLPAQCFIVFFQETHSLARCGGSTQEAEVSTVSVGLVHKA